MSKDKPGFTKTPGGVTGQGTRDVIEGIKQGDMSRTSSYSGDKGCHTGSNSPTTGRHGEPFGGNKK